MLRKLLRKTPLAWLQLKREKTRLAVAMAGIAFADILMFFQLGLLDALFDSAATLQYKLLGDLFIVNQVTKSLQSYRSFRRDRLYQAAGVAGVESVNWLNFDRGQWRNPQTRVDRPILIFGIDPTKPTLNQPDINGQLNKLKMLNRVLYDQTGRPEFGDIATLLQHYNPLSVQVNDYQVSVVGLFSLGASFAADGNAITSHSTFLRLFPNRQPDQIDIGLINLKPGADIKQVQANLQARLPNDVVVLTLDQFANQEKEYWGGSSPIGFIFGFGAVIGFLVGTVIVYQILYSDVSEHLPEYATMKAMGYSDSYLIGVIIQESLILAFLGFLPGFLISTGFYVVVQSATLLPVGMTLNRAVLVLGSTIVMCVISGVIAVRKLQAADPADIF